MTREQQIIIASHLYAKALQKPFIDGAMWADKHPKPLWKDSQGDDLPDIDREVIVIDKRGKVYYGHRPDKKHGYLGKSMLTNNIETFYPHTYGKGGWNIPDVRWWLDCSLPNLEEQ